MVPLAVTVASDVDYGVINADQPDTTTRQCRARRRMLRLTQRATGSSALPDQHVVRCPSAR